MPILVLATLLVLLPSAVLAQEAPEGSPPTPEAGLPPPPPTAAPPGQPPPQRPVPPSEQVPAWAQEPPPGQPQGQPPAWQQGQQPPAWQQGQQPPAWQQGQQPPAWQQGQQPAWQGQQPAWQQPQAQWQPPPPEPVTPFGSRGWHVAAEFAFLMGGLTGPAAGGYDLSGVGFGAAAGLRFLGHLAVEAEAFIPSAEVADDRAYPLSSESKMSLYGVGARVYLSREARVNPYFALGYSTFEIQTDYASLLAQNLPSFELSGDALKLALGVDVEIVRFSLWGGELALSGTAAVRYLLARWDKIYCADKPIIANPDGSTRSCVYTNEDGSFGRSDLYFASTGVALAY